MKKTSWWLGSLALLVLVPNCLLVFWAFADQWNYPHVLPVRYGLTYLWRAYGDPNFWQSIGNSTLIALISTLVALVIAIPACKFIMVQSILPFRLVELMIYLPIILPAIAIVTATETQFLRWGISGTYLGVIIMHVFFILPYAMQILLESYRKVGGSYELTAKNLGAGSWQTFWMVTYPLLRGGIMAAAGLCYIVSYSQYLPTFFIGDSNIITLPLLFMPFAYNGKYGVASVYSLVFIVTSLVGVAIIAKLIGRNPHGHNR